VVGNIRILVGGYDSVFFTGSVVSGAPKSGEGARCENTRCHKVYFMVRSKFLHC
jgi:hypothetical protein